MLNYHYTETLLGLKDVVVLKIEKVENTKSIWIQLKKTIHQCPNCNTFTDKVHDYRMQNIKDIPSFGDKTILYLRKRRYICPNCGKKIPEANSFVSRYQRMTSRLRAFMISRFAQVRSTKSISEECNCSPTTASRIFDEISYPKPNLPPAISIDEFKGNAGGHKFQCILTDPKKRKILDVLESRRMEELCKYFSEYDIGQRNNVKYVVIDMSSLFRSMIQSCFPKATIVADKFHVCRQVTWALERTRKEIQSSLPKQQRLYFKKSRWILLKRQENLNEEEKQQLENMLQLSKEIRNAYLLKEKFYYFMSSTNKAEAAKRLKAWNLYAGTINLPEFNKCVQTFCNWSNEILAAFDTGLSNGYTEGTNNKTKVLKRISYGIRNFKRFRNRLLYIANS